jgi:hypothetical protein
MKLSMQEIFDKSVGGILKQGRPGRSPLVGLQTITPEGYRCAIGMLAPDDLPRTTPCYRSEIEWPVWGLYEIRERIGAAVHGSPEDRLCKQLRHIHDNIGPADNWIALFTERARIVAENFGLSTAVIDSASA